VTADRAYLRAESGQRAPAPADEPVTEYGFVGRGPDIQAIEHRVLSARDGHQLVVRGMAGAGKSALLTHLAWRWRRTGLVDQVFRFSYQDRVWTSAQIIQEICAQLMSPAEHAQADPMTGQAQAEQVATLLCATRHLLILDNIESVTAPAEQGRLTREPRRASPPGWVPCSVSTARQCASSRRRPSRGIRKPGSGRARCYMVCSENAPSSDPANSPAWSPRICPLTWPRISWLPQRRPTPRHHR